MPLLPMRTNRNEIGVPFGCGIEDAHSDVTNLDSGVRLKSHSSQLLCNSLDQCTGRLFLILQLGSVALSHFRRSHGTIGCSTCKTRTSVF